MDVFFLAEVCWCTLLCGFHGIRSALILAGGFLSSGYLATQLSTWLEQTFVPPGSPAFTWLVTQVVAPPGAQSVLAQFLSPELTATSGANYNERIAVHVVHTLFFFAMTIAVFMLFLGTTYLIDALWDRPRGGAGGRIERVGSYGIGILCGLYIGLQTAEVIANVSWVREGTMFTSALDNSLWMKAIGHANTFLLYHPFH